MPWFKDPHVGESRRACIKDTQTRKSPIGLYRGRPFETWIYVGKCENLVTCGAMRVKNSNTLRCARPNIVCTLEEDATSVGETESSLQTNRKSTRNI